MATQATTVENKPPQHKEVEHFSDAERTEWLKTGKMPALEEEITPKPDASAASIPDKKPGSGPGKKAAKLDDEVKQEQERNWRTLETERDTLRTKAEAAERELEEYRSGKRKAEEKKPDANAPKLLEQPVRPKMKDFMADGALDSDKYETALDKYEQDKTAYVNQQTMMRTAAQQQEQSIKTWEADLKTKYGEKAAGVDVKKSVDKLAATLQTAPAFFTFLNDSEVFTDLLFVLGGAEFKLDELLAEAKDPKTVTRAIRKLTEIERDVKTELAKQTKEPAKAAAENNERKLTKAGKPLVEASGGSSTPEDDGSPDAAWRRKDLSVEDRGELYRERKNKQERDKKHKKVN